MHSWTGFATLFAGLGLAAYTFHPGGSGLDAAALFGKGPRAEAPAIDTVSEAVRMAPSLRSRLFSPQSPLFAPAQPVAAAAAPARGAVPVAEIADGHPVVTAAVQPWATTIQVSETPAAQMKSRSSRPASADARADLARDLQRELKRVGCYDGEVDGSWGGGSKRAMGAFNERVNATLPVEEPDYILLTLLQGHRDAACGAGCPSGQALADGRCQAKPQVAQAPAQRKPHKMPAAAAGLVAAGAVVVIEQEKRSVQRRVDSVAKAVDTQAVRPVSPVAPVSPVNVTASSAPAVATPQRPAVAVAAASPVATAAPVEPLPGRMTIGGPVTPAEAHRAPVYAAPDHAAPAPRVQPHRVAPQRAVRAPVHVAPPPRAPRPQQYASSGGSSSSSRQRSMVYNLFQRPDRY